MKNQAKIIAGIAILFTTNAFSGWMEPINNAGNWPWVVSLSAGPAWANPGTNQTILLAPETIKAFAARTPTHALAAGELFVGLQQPLMPQLLGQLGLAIAKTGDAQLQGTVWDDADPTFANYNYQYFVQTTRIAAKGKLLFDRGYWITPWISASVGIGITRAHGFSNTPLISEAAPFDNFVGHIETDFSYTLGIGFQKTLSPQWQVGAGYEFADWGESELGRAAGQTSNSGLSLNHLYTQGLMINLTYLK